MPTFRSPSWVEIQTAMIRIAGRIRSDGKQFDAIVGIARGGWVPARLLCDLLGIQRLISVQLVSYEKMERGKIKQLDMPELSGIGEVLLVDDVSDSGSSFKHSLSVISRSGVSAKTSAIYVKPWTAFRPDYYYQEVNEWVVFPWEVVEVVGPMVKSKMDSPEQISKKIGMDISNLKSFQDFFADCALSSKEELFEGSGRVAKQD